MVTLQFWVAFTPHPNPLPSEGRGDLFYGIRVLRQDGGITKVAERPRDGSRGLEPTDWRLDIFCKWLITNKRFLLIRGEFLVKMPRNQGISRLI